MGGVGKYWIAGYYAGDGYIRMRTTQREQIYLCSHIADREFVHGKALELGVELNWQRYSRAAERSLWPWEHRAMIRDLLHAAPSHLRQIPFDLQRLPEEKKWAVLSGLLSADGSFRMRQAKTGYAREAYLTSTSEGLMQAAELLSTALGLTYSRYKQDPNPSQKRVKTNHRLYYPKAAHSRLQQGLDLPPSKMEHLLNF